MKELIPFLIILTLLFWIIYELTLEFIKQLKELRKDYLELKKLENELKEIIKKGKK